MIRQALLVAALAGMTFQAQAANCSCSGNEQVMDSNLSTLLTGKRACVLKLGGSTPAWKYEWQELHVAGGQLIEANELTPVGSWLVSGTGTNTIVTHNYGTGGAYNYKVCQSSTNASKITFCGASADYDADLITGSCP